MRANYELKVRGERQKKTMRRGKEALKRKRDR